MQRTRRSAAGFVLLGLVSLVLSGCGDELGRVEAGGVVTYNGAPLEGATVTFVPTAKEGGVAGDAITGPDGKFTVNSAGGAGLPPGDYKVVIVKMQSSGFQGATPEETQEKMMQMMMKGPTKAQRTSAIPEQYGEAEKTPLKATVTDDPAKNQFEFTLQ
jgi:hypothetical protein